MYLACSALSDRKLLELTLALFVICRVCKEFRQKNLKLKNALKKNVLPWILNAFKSSYKESRITFSSHDI